jgi:hypothetical protein
LPDSFDQNIQDVGLSLDSIEQELRCGLALHSDRLVEAFDCEEFYAGRSQLYIPKRESEEWRDYLKRPKRTSKMLRKAVRTLAEDLYSPGPTRRLESDASVDRWLQDVYAANHVNALMKQADRKSTIHGACAIQVYGTGRPEKPIRLYLWSGHEFAIWGWDDDGTEPWAVCTISREREFKSAFLMERLRFEVWSRDEHRVYRGTWQQAPDAYGQGYVTTCYRYLFGQTMQFIPSLSGSPAGSGINPYGTLPFSFAHAEVPITDFWEGAIGPMLRFANGEIDREISDVAQHTKEFMDPDRFLTGISTAFRREKRPGNWQILTPGKNAEGDAADPKAFLLQGDLSTESVWYNVQQYMNGTFEELDVPLVAVRADASTDLSGIAIVAKHLPLLARTRSRQPDWAVAEADLVEVVLTCAGNFYAGSIVPAILRAAEKPKLELTWPEPRMPMPTPERDLQDAWEMDQGVSSLVGVVAQRYGITLEQAKEKIEQVIEENKWLKSVMPPPAPLDKNGNPVPVDKDGKPIVLPDPDDPDDDDDDEDDDTPDPPKDPS